MRDTMRVCPVALCAAVLAVVLFTPEKGQAQLLGPSVYTSFADSPFNGPSFSYFHLENFETGALTVPGVTLSAGNIIGPGGLTDSVDGDDGAIDGSGTNGRSLFFSDGPTGIRFTFNAAALGGNLPTHAGIVWTDGNNNIRFEAFDAGGASLGFLIGSHADGSSTGTTGEDRFYGATNAGGISAILLQNSGGGGGIEMDHLQYGLTVASVPEPGVLLLGAAGLTGISTMVARRRRLRRSRGAAVASLKTPAKARS